MKINQSNKTPFNMLCDYARESRGMRDGELADALKISERTLNNWKNEYTPKRCPPREICQNLFFKDDDDNLTDIQYEQVDAFLAYLRKNGCFVPTEWREEFSDSDSKFIKYFTAFLLDEDYIAGDEIFPATFHDLTRKGFTAINVAKQLLENDQRLYGNAAQESGVLTSNDAVFSDDNAGSAEQWSQYLSAWPDSFEYLVNSKNNIVGNYSFLSLTDEQYRDFCAGTLCESDLEPTKTRSLYQPDTTHILFVLNISVNSEYNTIENSIRIRAMFWNKIAQYSQNQVLFKKIIVNVFHPAHEAFYESLGFKFKCEHPKGGRIFELNMFPYPERLSEELSRNPAYFSANKILKKAYGFTCIQLTPDYELTDMQLSDIAKCIYNTDEYIYPCLFDDIDAACQVLPDIIESNEDSMFKKENLFVAFSNDRVVGIVLFHKGSVDWEKSKLVETTKEKRLPFPTEFDRACKEYLCEYNKTPEDTLAIINVCIAEEFRSAGLGSLLMKKFCDRHLHSQMELFVLEKNEGARRIYEESGFKVVSRENGFSRDRIELPCLKMKCEV